MNLSTEEKETADNYVLDVVNTFYSNIFLFLGTFVAMMYLVAFNQILESFTLPEMRIIGLFVFAYSAIKITFALSCNINFEYKLRKK